MLAAMALLTRLGHTRGAELRPLKGGANNRVFEIHSEGLYFLLKAYFQHPDDPRDRLGAEFAFCEYAWNHAIRCVPQPHAADPANHLGLYEFIPGRRAEAEDATPEAVDRALAFFKDLNAPSNRAGATLPVASEACFSLAEHLQRVGSRVERLAAVRPAQDTDRQAADFIGNRLTPAWKVIAARVESEARNLPPAVSRPLDEAARCVSPSDFGFHNVLVTPGGELRFIDFEYAGWDDPAKMVCDFFCQVEAPVPFENFDRFAEGATAGRPDAAACRERVRLLLPVYRVKWCCIVLNDFLPMDSARRRFARSDTDEEARKKTQLAKAIALFERYLAT